RDESQRGHDTDRALELLGPPRGLRRHERALAVAVRARVRRVDDAAARGDDEPRVVRVAAAVAAAGAGRRDPVRSRWSGDAVPRAQSDVPVQPAGRSAVVDAGRIALARLYGGLELPRPSKVC